MDTVSSFCAFTVPDLWRPSLLTASETDTTSLFTDFELDVTAIRLHNPYAPKTSLENELQLPSLESFQYGPLEDLELEESVISTDLGEIKEQEEDEEDIWSLAVKPLAVKKHCFSWELFLHGEDNSQTPHLSEWGPLAFNAAVQTFATQSTIAIVQGPVAKSDVTLKALFDLALGRSSTLYTWDERRKTFLPAYQDIASSGYTTTTYSGLSRVMLECGSSIKRLRKFAEKTYASRDVPSRVALANAVSTVISGVETHLTSGWPHLRSLLQLQAAVEKPRYLLQQMLDLVLALRISRTDEHISSIMFNWCQRIEHESTWLSSIMLEVLSRISSPLLERMDSWIGFPSRAMVVHSQSSSLAFIKANDTQEAEFSATRYGLEETLLPDYISTDVGEIIMEVGLGLKLLTKHHPNHILIQTNQQATGINLQWKQSWSELDEVVGKARKYEQDLAAAVRQYSNLLERKQDGLTCEAHSGNIGDIDEAREVDYESAFTISLNRFSQEPLHSHREVDELLGLVQARMMNSSLEQDLLTDNSNKKPSLDLLSILSFSPLLHAQARLVRGACLRTLFRSHDLRTHLRVQRSFHLMGDGVFVFRLSAALFDSSAATTERQLGVMRSGSGMGLKLSDRRTWPPASSELRLALMGILSDCYQSSVKPLPHDERKQELPGSLSFAIRSLSEHEISKIMDPHSLHALDFLRLQYSAPSPVDVIITSLSLEKYDTIFKFLLRLIRLLFTVSRFPTSGATRATLAFCNQARHFINACAQHFFNSAVDESWSAFTKHLDIIEDNLATEDAENPATMRDFGGIEDLRRRHDDCLDSMLFGLLLRQRQVKILALLEDIFGLVLKLEIVCGGTPAEETKVRALHVEFVDKVGVFLDVCRGLSGKMGYGADIAGGQGNMIERLVNAVDFNGFYSLQKRR